MFYRTKVQDFVRVSPELFGSTTEEAITKVIKEKYAGYVSEELGIVVDVLKVDEVREGVVIPGDGAPYYDSDFELLTFKPEMHEVVIGKIKDIADFGAFMNMGPIEGMIHISQTMDDQVSLSKEKTLFGKNSKKTLGVNDNCRARIIAVSFKDFGNPKIGLTMRQQGLGKLEWIEEDRKRMAPKEGSEKPEKPAKKGKEAAQ